MTKQHISESTIAATYICSVKSLKFKVVPHKLLGSVVDINALLESGLIGKALDGVKVLGNGELEKKLTVKAEKFSKSAVEKIEKAGGKAEVI